MKIDEKAFQAFMLAWREHGGTGLGFRKCLEAYEAVKPEQPEEWSDADEDHFRKNHPYIGKGGTVTAIPVSSIYRGVDIPNEQPDEFSLLGVLADIRQKTGIGDKVMLSELADTLAALIQNGDSAIDTNKRLVSKLHEREISLEDEIFRLKELLNIACPFVPRTLMTNDSEMTVYKRIREILTKPTSIEGQS